MGSMGDEIGFAGAYSGDGYGGGAYDLGYSGSYEAAPLDSGILTTPTYLSDHLSPSSSQSAMWNRAVKRKLEPGELLSQLSSLKSTPRAPEPTNSPPANNNGDFDYTAELEQLREKIKDQEKQIQSLYDDLDEERKAAASAVSETMEMIRRLNDEKAAAQLEARQMKQFADDLAAHHEEELDELEKELDIKDGTIADLEAQMKLYRERMKHHGIEPDGESEYESEDGRGIVEKPYDSASDWISNSKYQMYQPRRDDGDLDMKMRKILTRLEVLETDRESVRRDMMAMRSEKAQLVLMRDIATRLCTQVAAERRMVKKSSGPKFSVLGVFKVIPRLLGYSE
jgi:DNA repair exonuclease SbcCD ATPase subunit